MAGVEFFCLVNVQCRVSWKWAVLSFLVSHLLDGRLVFCCGKLSPWVSVNYGLFSVKRKMFFFFHTGLVKWGQVNGKYSAHMIGQNPVFFAIRLADLPRSCSTGSWIFNSLSFLYNAFLCHQTLLFRAVKTKFLSNRNTQMPEIIFLYTVTTCSHGLSNFPFHKLTGSLFSHMNFSRRVLASKYKPSSRRLVYVRTLF